MTNDMKNKDSLTEMLGVIGAPLAFFVGIAGAAAGHTYALRNVNIIPNTAQVQQGYVSPNQIQIECVDRDFNGIPETYFRIGKDSFAVMGDNGNYKIVKYNVTPAEVTPSP